MIDFVKIGINATNLAERLLNSEGLVFEPQKGKQVATRQNLKITVHESRRVEVAGSLHKYWNGGLHNYNDFGRLDLWDVINEMCDWLEIAPQDAHLHNVEFGVNLAVPFDPTAFLGGLLVYKNEPFVRTAITGKGFYKQAAKSQYLIKTYDKGKQYDRPDHILRFEMKVVKMEYLNGVRTLADLMQVDKLSVLGGLLAEAWRECVVVEWLDVAQLTPAERRTYERATNAAEWNNLNDRMERHRLRTNYAAIMDKYLKGGKKKEVAELLQTKWHELLAIPKSCYVLTNLPNGEMLRYDPSNIVSECNKEGDLFSITEPSIKCGGGGAAAPKVVVVGRCLITGFSIGHQKAGSKFVGEFTVKETEELQHRLIKTRRKNKRKRTHHPPEYYGAHNARNDYHNPRHNLLKRIERAKAQTTLFELSEVLRLNDAQRKLVG
jgi:hypothetical protein